MKNKNFRADIQGLRALAVISVILFHVNKEWLPGGFIGVDIFFVISGYLISSIILSKERVKFSYFEFYKKRLLRILPAYISVSFFTLIIMIVLLTPKDFNFFKDSYINSILFFSNVYFSNFGNYFAPSANELPLLHTWSLSIEMQVYLFLPFLLICINKRLIPVISVVMIFLTLIYTHYEIYYYDNESNVYFSLFSRLGEFLIGTILCFFKEKEIISTKVNKNIIALVGLFMIIFSFILIEKNSPFPGLLALPSTLGTGMIILSKGSKLNILLSRKALVYIGGISYSLYLWHWPILSVIRYTTGKYNLTIPELVVFFFLTISLATLTYHFIEERFRRPNIKNERLLICSYFIISLIIPLSSYLNNNLIDDLDYSHKTYADIDKICHNKVLANCEQGDITSKIEYIVLGDSHGAHLNTTLDIIGKKQGLKFNVITASNCVTIPNYPYKELPNYFQKKCLEQIKNVENLLNNSNNIIIAGHWVFQTNQKSFIDRLDSFIKSMTESGKKIYVVSQIPLLDMDISRVTRFKSLGVNFDIEIFDRWMKANNLIEEITKKYEYATFINIAEFPIFKTPPYFEGEMTYSDQSHLNKIGAKILGEQLSKGTFE
ncbi:acyltransferase family protein [Vibrio proteolyticus]